MSKTGLINHAFNKLFNGKNSSTFYIDIQDKLNLAELKRLFNIERFEELAAKIKGYDR